MKLKFLRILFVGVSLNFFGQTNTPSFSEYNFPKIESNILMPIEIPISEITTILNGSIKDLIYEDNSFTDNNNDQLKLKVWKTGNIKLSTDTSGNLITEVPLKIWAEKGIGTMGVYAYQDTTFETVVSLKSSVSLSPNWTFITKTQLLGLKWIKKPIINFGGLEISISKFVELNLKQQQEKLFQKMDQKIASELNFKKYALVGWNAVSAPFNISKEYNTWLKITPTGFSVSPLQFKNNQINTNIGINVYTETYTGITPTNSPLATTIPNLSIINAAEKPFKLQTTANILYSEATRIAKETFLHKEFDLNDSKVKIEDIKVYSEKERILVEVKTEGYVNGVAIVSGIPTYDEAKKKIILTDTNFKLKTANILHKTASILFKGRIVRMIEEDYGIPTSSLENESKQSIEDAFGKEYYQGVKIIGKVLSLKPSQILIGTSGITAIIDTEANIKLKIKDLVIK